MNENSTNRFGNFFDRVQTERVALKIVNARFSDAKKLHGLTEAAINAWIAVMKNTEDGVIGNIEAIGSILKRLSARIDALADQSRTVFSNERFPMLPSEEILDELASVCRGIKS
ncbi:MAG: hypothetical protein WBM09_05025 [Gallionella sp.]